MHSKILKVLKTQSHILLGLVFGSVAKGKENEQSDLDIAVASEKVLTLEERLNLTEKLTKALGKEVDLIDLLSVSGIIQEQALTTGKVLLNRKPTVYAQLMKKMLLDKADFRPYYDRILAKRRHAFLNS